MNLLFWFIIIIVIGMVAFPIMQLVPRAGQKHQIALRQQAMQHGLKILVRQPELPQQLKNQYYELKECVAYHLPCKNSSLQKNYLALKSSSSGEWFWIRDTYPPGMLMNALNTVFNDLPDYCQAIEIGQAGSFIYLNDSLDSVEITKIEHGLENLNQVISE